MKHLSISAGLIIGLLLSYVIHYRWHYFGAMLVTFKTILGVWICMPVIGGCVGMIVCAVISDSKG